MAGLDSDDWLEGRSVHDDLDVGGFCLSDLVKLFVDLMVSKSEGCISGSVSVCIPLKQFCVATETCDSSLRSDTSARFSEGKVVSVFETYDFFFFA